MKTFFIGMKAIFAAISVSFSNLGGVLNFEKNFFDSVKMPLVTVTFKTRACTLWVNTCCIEDAVY